MGPKRRRTNNPGGRPRKRSLQPRDIDQQATGYSRETCSQMESLELMRSNTDYEADLDDLQPPKPQRKRGRPKKTQRDALVGLPDIGERTVSPARELRKKQSVSYKDVTLNEDEELGTPGSTSGNHTGQPCQIAATTSRQGSTRSSDENYRDLPIRHAPECTMSVDASGEHGSGSDGVSDVTPPAPTLSASTNRDRQLHNHNLTVEQRRNSEDDSDDLFSCSDSASHSDQDPTAAPEAGRAGSTNRGTAYRNPSNLQNPVELVKWMAKTLYEYSTAQSPLYRRPESETSRLDRLDEDSLELKRLPQLFSHIPDIMNEPNFRAMARMVQQVTPKDWARAFEGTSDGSQQLPGLSFRAEEKRLRRYKCPKGFSVQHDIDSLCAFVNEPDKFIGAFYWGISRYQDNLHGSLHMFKKITWRDRSSGKELTDWVPLHRIPHMKLGQFYSEKPISLYLFWPRLYFKGRNCNLINTDAQEFLHDECALPALRVALGDTLHTDSEILRLFQAKSRIMLAHKTSNKAVSNAGTTGPNSTELFRGIAAHAYTVPKAFSGRFLQGLMERVSRSQEDTLNGAFLFLNGLDMKANTKTHNPEMALEGIMKMLDNIISVTPSMKKDIFVDYGQCIVPRDDGIALFHRTEYAQSLVDGLNAMCCNCNVTPIADDSDQGHRSDDRQSVDVVEDGASNFPPSANWKDSKSARFHALPNPNEVIEHRNLDRDNTRSDEPYTLTEDDPFQLYSDDDDDVAHDPEGEDKPVSVSTTPVPEGLHTHDDDGVQSQHHDDISVEMSQGSIVSQPDLSEPTRTKNYSFCQLGLYNTSYTWPARSRGAKHGFRYIQMYSQAYAITRFKNLRWLEQKDIAPLGRNPKSYTNGTGSQERTKAEGILLRQIKALNTILNGPGDKGKANGDKGKANGDDPGTAPYISSHASRIEVRCTLEKMEEILARQACHEIQEFSSDSSSPHQPYRTISELPPWLIPVSTRNLKRYMRLAINRYVAAVVKLSSKIHGAVGIDSESARVFDMLTYNLEGLTKAHDWSRYPGMWYDYHTSSPKNSPDEVVEKMGMGFRQSLSQRHVAFWLRRVDFEKWEFIRDKDDPPGKSVSDLMCHYFDVHSQRYRLAVKKQIRADKLQYHDEIQTVINWLRGKDLKSLHADTKVLVGKMVMHRFCFIALYEFRRHIWEENLVKYVKQQGKSDLSNFGLSDFSLRNGLGAGSIIPDRGTPGRSLRTRLRETFRKTWIETKWKPRVSFQRAYDHITKVIQDPDEGVDFGFENAGKALTYFQEELFRYWILHNLAVPNMTTRQKHTCGKAFNDEQRAGSQKAAKRVVILFLSQNELDEFLWQYGKPAYGLDTTTGTYQQWKRCNQTREVSQNFHAFSLADLKLPFTNDYLEEVFKRSRDIDEAISTEYRGDKLRGRPVLQRRLYELEKEVVFPMKSGLKLNLIK